MTMLNKEKPMDEFFSDMAKMLEAQTIDGRPMTPEEITSKICHIIDSTNHCLMCGQHSYGIAIFVPNQEDQAAFGNFSTKGKKLRQIFYGLCFWHQSYIGSQAIETKMKDHFARYN